MAQYPGHDTPISPAPASAGRRQSLAAECSRADVARAIMRQRADRVSYTDGIVAATSQAQALAAFDAITHPSLTRKRADGRATVLQLWRVLVWCADRGVERRRRQLLVSISQARLIERLGKSERTVQYGLRLLEEIGLLRVVREGTTDEYQAPHQREGNVVPVYVLTVPLYVLPDVPGGPAILAALQDRSVPDGGQPGLSPVDGAAGSPTGPQRARTARPCPGQNSARGRLRSVDLDEVSALVSTPVDIDCTPSLSPFRGQGTPTRTRECDPQEPLRGTPSWGAVPRHGAGFRPPSSLSPAQGGATRRGVTSSGNRPGDRWPAHATPARRSEALAAADELRTRVLALRVMSPAYVRHIVREFFLAGWNVLDLQHAVDWRPDGTKWTQDSLPWSVDPAGRTTPEQYLARRAAAWLAHRLAAWRDETGTVRRSRHQQLVAESAEAAARRRAARAADEKRATRPSATSPGRENALATAREIAARRRAAVAPGRAPWMPADLR